MTPFVDVDNAVRKRLISRVRTENQFSEVYRYEDSILKVPNKLDFEYWSQTGFSPDQFVSLIPTAQKAEYEAALPPGVHYKTKYVAYSFWKAYERTWTYNRLQRAFRRVPCGVPATQVVFGAKKWGFFSTALVPIVRQQRIPGPTLREMLQRSSHQTDPDVVLYELKPEYHGFRAVVCEALGEYIRNGGERRDFGATRSTYTQWLRATFPAAIDVFPDEPPILDMNPTNFILHPSANRLYYVDVDAEGLLQEDANRVNQNVLERVLAGLR